MLVALARGFTVVHTKSTSLFRCRLVIDGFASSSGTYRLGITCPQGAYYQGTLGCNATVVNSTAGASHSLVGHPAPEHLYRFTAPSSGAYVFNTCGSSFDTFLVSSREPDMHLVIQVVLLACQI